MFCTHVQMETIGSVVLNTCYVRFTTGVARLLFATGYTRHEESGQTPQFFRQGELSKSTKTHQNIVD